MSHFGVDLGIKGVRSIIVVVVDDRICTGNVAQIIIVDRATCNGTERDDATVTVAVRIHISFVP